MRTGEPNLEQQKIMRVQITYYPLYVDGITGLANSIKKCLQKDVFIEDSGDQILEIMGGNEHDILKLREELQINAAKVQ